MNIDSIRNNVIEKIWNDQQILKLLVLGSFLIIVIFSSWMCDDAYHGFVMAKHLIEGNGFVYNIGERVNAATNPLFILVVAGMDALSGSMYASATIVSILFSVLAVVFLLTGFCNNKIQIAEAFVLLCSCKSFMTYTTSGLENCLLFFLSSIIMYIVLKNDVFDKKQLLYLALLFSAVAMTRMDNALIYAPLTVYIFIFKRKNVGFIKGSFIGLTGLMPFLLWEVFSLFYYGSFLPNTAYIKLNTGISSAVYIERGLEYFGMTFLNDMPVILLPVAVIILCLGIKDNKYRLIAAGMIFYLLYLVRIGGDFMLGRHFTVLYFISSFVMMQVQTDKGYQGTQSEKRNGIIITGVFAAIAICSLMLGQIYGKQFLWRQYRATKAGVADEREFYYPHTALMTNINSKLVYNKMVVRNIWDEEDIDKIREENRKRALLDWAAGIKVYYNSDLYLQDPIGLGDPLLSKLPAAEIPEESFRVGHMYRDIPEGYVESIENNDNEISDPALHEYYDKILLITRGSLFDENRIKTIIGMLKGEYDYLLKNYIKGAKK